MDASQQELDVVRFVGPEVDLRQVEEREHVDFPSISMEKSRPEWIQLFQHILPRFCFQCCFLLILTIVVVWELGWELE